MGLGDWACLQIETQDPSLSQGLPRWSCRQSMVYLMLLSPAFQEQYIGRMCAYLNFQTFQPDIDVGMLTRSASRYPALKQLILNPTGLEQGRFFILAVWLCHVWKRHFCSPPALFQGNRLHSSSLEKHFSLGAKFTMNALKDLLKV